MNVLTAEEIIRVVEALERFKRTLIGVHASMVIGQPNGIGPITPKDIRVEFHSILVKLSYD